MDATAKLTASTRFSIADLGGEAVILDPESGSYYGLNPTGIHIMKYLSEPRSLTEIIGEVATVFKAEPEAIATEIESFIADLIEAGLIRS